VLTHHDFSSILACARQAYILLSPPTRLRASEVLVVNKGLVNFVLWSVVVLAFYAIWQSAAAVH